MASAAFSATVREVATMAATGSPTKRTISCASSRRGGTVIGEPSGRLKIASVGMVPMSSLIRSAPVKTASTPGIPVAACVSIDLIFACACGERSTCSHSAPSSGLSSMNCPFPVEQPVIFQSLDRLTGTKPQIGGKNIHQICPSVSCKAAGF